MAAGASDLTYSGFRLHELGPYIGLYSPNPEPAFALPPPPPIQPLLPVNNGLLHSTNSAFTVQLVAFLVIRSILQSAKGVCPLHNHTLAMLMIFLVCMKPVQTCQSGSLH